MKLPQQYFANLTAGKYREYLKLLPNMQQENTRIITTLILTFVAMSFFGIFAINPTLSTIINLKKQLSDSTLVNKKLDEKISNLSSLQQQYTALGPDLPFVLSAIPQRAEAPTLLGQIYGLGQQSNVKVDSFSIADIQLLGDDSNLNNSYTFTLQVAGSYENLIGFTKDLASFDRAVSVESVAISKDSKKDELFMNIEGRAFFQK